MNSSINVWVSFTSFVRLTRTEHKLRQMVVKTTFRIRPYFLKLQTIE